MPEYKNNVHVQRDIGTTDLISSQHILLSVADAIVDLATGQIELTDNAETDLGLVMGISIGDSRPVQVQGEIGSNFLVTLINEGQQQLSFQRLIPIPYADEDDNALGGKPASALSQLYQLGNTYNDIMMYDLEEYTEFKRPIQLILKYYAYSAAEDSDVNEELELITKVWLKNASVASTAMSFTAGANYTAEPITISWEDTINLPVGTSVDNSGNPPASDTETE